MPDEIEITVSCSVQVGCVKQIRVDRYSSALRQSRQRELAYPPAVPALAPLCQIAVQRFILR
jgi:hypothetical protein